MTSTNFKHISFFIENLTSPIIRRRIKTGIKIPSFIWSIVIFNGPFMKSTCYPFIVFQANSRLQQYHLFLVHVIYSAQKIFLYKRSRAYSVYGYAWTLPADKRSLWKNIKRFLTAIASHCALISLFHSSVLVNKLVIVFGNRTFISDVKSARSEKEQAQWYKWNISLATTKLW